MSDGLKIKYILTKPDGELVDELGKYFVLKLNSKDNAHARASVAAARAYAAEIKESHPGLAKDLEQQCRSAEIEKQNIKETVTGVWPDLIAPKMYPDAAPEWEDPKLPELRLIWKLARECGYAVGVHGSLRRDVDLIAIPWTEIASSKAALVDHLCNGLNAIRIGDPEEKPHGRIAVTLQIDGYFKPIDLSIMPKFRPAKKDK